MSDLTNGERQVAPTLDGIRRDHVARYEFAAKLIGNGKRVIDLACGIGYGAAILADAGSKVLAVDRSAEALAYAAKHYSRRRVSTLLADAAKFSVPRGAKFDVAVCFETIEHVADPLPMLRALRRATKTLIASVPNEAVFPHRGRIRFHHRHYTREQFADLLAAAGWRVTSWHGQLGPQSDVDSEVEGRTLIAVAKRCRPLKQAVAAPEPAKVPASVAPKRVAILGLGPSLEMYVDHVKRMGGRRVFCDEVWAINALGDILQCDRVFHMDDLRVQERRAEAVPGSNIAAMVEWLKRHPGPVYTSQHVDGYPGLVEFPLEEVINSTGQAYFNSTAAYAVAYAIHIGVEEINCFGIDFSYPNAHHAEKGRACVEFWLGMASARGIRVGVPENTSLLDTIEGHDAHFYGYDAVKVKLGQTDTGTRVSFEPRPLPAAADMEKRYDHSKHPNPHVSGQAKGA